LQGVVAEPLLNPDRHGLEPVPVLLGVALGQVGQRLGSGGLVGLDPGPLIGRTVPQIVDPSFDGV
jgi:hypothetical protein